MKKYFTNNPVLKIDFGWLSKQGVSEQDVKKYIPDYILNPVPMSYGYYKKLALSIIQIVLSIFVWVFLSPRRGEVGNLGIKETEKVYNKEAKTYNDKHHFTTRGIDTVWRRQAGQFVVNHILEKKDSINTVNILDLCTGTGLTIKEMTELLSIWRLKAIIIGLDYNSEMLNIARRNVKGNNNISVKFIRANVMNMTNNTAKELTTLNQNSFDVVTQVFGIGGISYPVKVFQEILHLLKENGQFFLIDMHKPVPQIPGEWPLFFKWIKMPLFEIACYEDTTLPLVLNRLWAWRDTTALFYLIRLITTKDCNGKYYGFRVVSFEHQSQRWWFALPLMPVAKIIVEKEEISKEVALKRDNTLAACS